MRGLSRASVKFLSPWVFGQAWHEQTTRPVALGGPALHPPNSLPSLPRGQRWGRRVDTQEPVFLEPHSRPSHGSSLLGPPQSQGLNWKVVPEYLVLGLALRQRAPGPDAGRVAFETVHRVPKAGRPPPLASPGGRAGGSLGKRAANRVPCLLNTIPPCSRDKSPRLFLLPGFTWPSGHRQVTKAVGALAASSGKWECHRLFVWSCENQE